MKYFLLLFALATISTSCSKDAPGLTVDEYIIANNLTTTELAEGVHIIIHNPGEGFKPNINSNIEVKYEGKLTDGTVFDSRENSTFALSGVVKGWQIGLPEIALNGSCTLIIPSDAGYGDNDNGDIPGGSTLVFDITLLDIIL